MQNNFTDIAERIEQRASVVTEALLQESKSLEQVEQTLNKRYSESVTNVLNSLRNSMETQENELLSKKLEQVSEQIEIKSNEILADWERRMKNTQEAMSEIRQQIVKEDEEALKIQKTMLDKSREQTSDMMQRWEEANKEKANYTWLWIMMFSIWTVGMIVVGSWLSQNPQILKSESKEITMEQVNEKLKQEYEIEKYENGQYILIPKGEN